MIENLELEKLDLALSQVNTELTKVKRLLNKLSCPQETECKLIAQSLYTTENYCKKKYKAGSVEDMYVQKINKQLYDFNVMAMTHQLCLQKCYSV
ncbi:MAG: hypothetical protein EOP34_09400 [Rickettsiales bacterium]|nr:MAG: hypothetical protein EOP34_09400 [Rickettsiales bacterium]